MANTGDDKDSREFTPVSISPKSSSSSDKKKVALPAKIPKIRPVGGSDGFLARLKRLTKRDLAFIVAGVSILIMLPMAEFFMTSPSSGGLLSPGFGSRSGTGPAGELYEPGTGGFAPGSDTGDVITPLSARDPSSLILSPAGPDKPQTPPPAPKSEGFRDALKDAARGAVSEAVRSAGAPAPRPQMQGALRGLGGMGGGAGSSSSAAIPGTKILQSAQDAPSKASPRSSVGPLAMPGYKGVGQQSLGSSGKNSFEQLKSKAGSAADQMNQGPASRALDRAAQDSPSVGSGMGGSGSSSGAKDSKGGSESSVKNSNSMGESLEFLRQRTEMQKAIEYRWKWKELLEFEIPKMFLMGGANASIDNFIKPLGEGFKNLIFGSAPKWACFGEVKNPPGANVCHPLKDREPLLIDTKDAIMKTNEARKDNCPCGIGPYEKKKEDGQGAVTPPAPPAVAPNDSAGTDLTDNINQSAEVFKNLNINIEKAGLELEKRNFKKAYSFLNGAFVSAEAALNSVKAGINAITNRRASFSEKIPSVTRLLESVEGKASVVSGDVTLLNRQVAEAENRIYSSQDMNAIRKYKELMSSRDFAEFEKKSHGSEYGDVPLEVNAARGHWRAITAGYKVQSALDVVGNAKTHMSRVVGFEASVGQGLEGVSKNHEELETRVAQSKRLLERSQYDAEHEADFLYKVYSDFAGSSDKNYTQVAPAGDIKDLDENYTPDQAPVGFAVSIRLLLGGKPEMEKETAYSREYLKNDKSSSYQIPENLAGLAARHDIVKEDTGIVERGTPIEASSFLSLASAHGAEAERFLKASKPVKMVAVNEEEKPAAPARINDKGEPESIQKPLNDGKDAGKGGSTQ